MKKILISLLIFQGLIAHGQEKTLWNKKQCAVVLTYDDALNVHLDNAIPALDSLQLKGTFFLTVSSPAFTKRLNEWRKAAAKGHELANHTIFHPCDGSLPGRGFVTADYDLSKYTVRRMTDEIRQTNVMLEAIDGKKERTFAYPCGDTKIRDSFYLAGLKGEFIAARGVQSRLVQLRGADIYNIDCYGINGQPGVDLIKLVQKAMETNSMIVFLFHGVGGEHALNVSLEAHSQLLHFLKEHEKEIWNPTFIEAAKYLRGVK